MWDMTCPFPFQLEYFSCLRQLEVIGSSRDNSSDIWGSEHELVNLSAMKQLSRYGQKSPKTEKWLMSPSNPALYFTSSISSVLWDKHNGHKNFYTFTFNSVQKMAKSDSSHWCEKYWIILEWGTAQALKIGKIYCESDWILRPVNIKMTPAAIVCQLQRCHTKRWIHLYMCS